MSDIKIGGSNGEGAETYIGVFGEIWIDRTGGIRRSNGSTPGGVIIGGGDITSLTASVEANTTVIGYHTALINATDITHASNTATLQGNIDTNTASIAALPSPRITLTIDQSAIGDINNKTEINADTYSHVFVYNDVSAARYFKLLDGSYDGQEISINRYHAGGSGIQIEALFEQTDGTSSLSLKAVGKPDMSPPTNGTFVWNGNMWWKV